jgi:hypothetical protein
VLHSHLRPDGPAPPADRGENELMAGQEAVVSTSPCAGGGYDSRGAAAGRVGDGEQETCVFCRIIRDEAPAFKVRRALSSSYQLFPCCFHGVRGSFLLNGSVAWLGLGCAVVDKRDYTGASSPYPKTVLSHRLTSQFSLSESCG